MDQGKTFLVITPVEDLVVMVEIDYIAYRQKIQRLYEEHLLFAEQLDVPDSNLEDLAA